MGELTLTQKGRAMYQKPPKTGTNAARGTLPGYGDPAKGSQGTKPWTRGFPSSYALLGSHRLSPDGNEKAKEPMA